jgi:hypothetical protein
MAHILFNKQSISEYKRKTCDQKHQFNALDEFFKGTRPPPLSGVSGERLIKNF